MPMEYEVGDIVKLKKQHPCGSQEWEILRVGADFRLKCMGCGHQVIMPRRQVEKKYERAEKRSGREEELSYYAGILQLFYEMLPGSEQNKKSGKQEKKACLSTFFMV